MSSDSSEEIYNEEDVSYESEDDLTEIIEAAMILVEDLREYSLKNGLDMLTGPNAVPNMVELMLL